MLATSSRPLAAAARAQARRNASTIATKYSHAAYKAALAKSPATLNKVQSELTAIAASLKETPALSAFVANPLLSSNERTAGLEALFKAGQKGAKEPVTDVTKNLFAILSENGRLSETPRVIEGFNELVSEYKGELEIVVTSASPLPKDVLSKLEASLKQSEAGKQAKVLKISNKVNASVLGGIVVDVGDKTIDLSVASRVTKLNTLLQPEQTLVTPSELINNGMHFITGEVGITALVRWSRCSDKLLFHYSGMKGAKFVWLLRSAGISMKISNLPADPVTATERRLVNHNTWCGKNAVFTLDLVTV
ncbi:hypothetical protein M0805_008285 [Coniferiporia weirii]|nr:hypothetical protein M0805_008285 [Coniferiporia weirii]